MNRIKSHIQMPRFMLERFENSKHELYYLNIQSKERVSRGHAKSINSELGYYDEYTERILDKSIETPFSQLLSKTDLTTGFCITEDIEKIVKRFYSSLLVRDPSMIKAIDSKSIMMQFVEIDDYTKRNLYTEVGIKNNYKTGLFDDYFLSVLINETSTPFVLPNCGFYAIGNNKEKYLILPINPFQTFVLISKTAYDRYVDNNSFTGLRIEKEIGVKNLNEVAVISQAKKEWGYIVCPEKQELERIKCIIWNEVE